MNIIKLELNNFKDNKMLQFEKEKIEIQEKSKNRRIMSRISQLEDKLQEVTSANERLSQYELLFNFEKEKNIVLQKQLKEFETNYQTEIMNLKSSNSKQSKGKKL